MLSAGDVIVCSIGGRTTAVVDSSPESPNKSPKLQYFWPLTCHESWSAGCHHTASYSYSWHEKSSSVVDITIAGACGCHHCVMVMPIWGIRHRCSCCMRAESSYSRALLWCWELLGRWLCIRIRRNHSFWFTLIIGWEFLKLNRPLSFPSLPQWNINHLNWTLYGITCIHSFIFNVLLHFLFLRWTRI